jgi:MoxR-like ATPase
MATQNPLEQEGTYPLPEAQLDRFLMHVTITYPEHAHEREILALARLEALQSIHATPAIASVLPQAQVFAARRDVLAVHLSDVLEQYLLALVFATRDAAPYGADIASWVRYGASPRATIALDRCARAHAWLAGRDYVNPGDIHAIAPDVLRHRIILNDDAVAAGVTPDQFIDALLNRVPVP